MRIEQIDADAKVLIGDAYDSSALALIRGDDVLLIEALGSKKDAIELQQLFQREGKTVRKIIITHYFSDHIAALSLFPDAEIIAHKNYRFTFDSEQNRSEEERSFFSEPDVTFNDEMRLRWGRFHLHLAYNPGHTLGTILVEIPELDLIHVGDTVVGNIVYLAYSTPSLLHSALDRIRRSGFRRILSSHEGLRDAIAVQYARHYLHQLEEKAFSCSREVFLQSDLSAYLPGDVQATPFEAIFHRRNLRSVVERKLFATA